MNEGRVVKAMQTRPFPPVATGWLYEAFFVLSPSRARGMDLGPIPLSEMRAYCELWCIDDPEDVEELVLTIRAMDEVYLKYQRDERERRAAAKANR
jgi:hypothetical protein